MFEIEELREQTAKIRVIGVGGAGGNAVNNMIAAKLKGIDFIAINTDLQVLETSLAPQKIQIGADLTRGLGAGSDPDIGRQAALHDYDAIAERLHGSDMVFITAGMGGGTGTGASSVVASIAKELGALTVAVITKPFFYEGKKRLMNAEDGIKELRQHVDTIIVIPNDRISLVVEKGTPLLKSFTVANNVLRQAVQGISDLILTPGLINLDFADVKTVIEDSGRAVIGIGSGNGEAGAVEAAKKAISNPLLEDSSVEGARGILVNITGGIELALSAVQEATSLIHDSAHEDVNIIFGAVIDSDMTDEVRITVIATGFEPKKEKVVLEDVKTWRPKPSLSLKAKTEYTSVEKLLSKTLKGMPSEPLPTELMSYDDPYDMPPYLRKHE
jgi:cell division protein FtsZ